MQGNPKIVELLNHYLTMELTAVNTYFAHSRMCANWGYGHLTEKFREVAFSEMRDAEEAVDRILYFEGVPNMQRLEAVTLGESVREQLDISVRVEREAIEWLNGAVATCVEEGDQGTREFLARKIPDEEEHLDWFEAQLDLIDQVGEQNYLAQQIHERGE